MLSPNQSRVLVSVRHKGACVAELWGLASLCIEDRQIWRGSLSSPPLIQAATLVSLHGPESLLNCEVGLGLPVSPVPAPVPCT